MLEIAFRRATSGGSTPVYRVDLGTERAFLRLGEQPGETREAEVRAHELLRERDLPIPEVLRSESAPPELDRCAMLTRAIPGGPLLDRQLPADQWQAILRQAGRDLARITEIPVQGFGWADRVDPADASLIAEHPTRSAWIAEYAIARDTILGSDLFPPDVARQLDDVMNDWIALPDTTTSALAHGDFDATHIFVDGDDVGTYTGIIDFGELRGADPLYDLGHAHLQDQQQDRRPIVPDLLAGVREITPLPDDVLLQIRRQAIAIGTRQLAIFQRRQSPWTTTLAAQLVRLASDTSR